MHLLAKIVLYVLLINDNVHLYTIVILPILKFLYDKYQMLWIEYQDSWWWTVSLSETCRVLYQNTVDKYFILLASIIRMYQDARSSECQKRYISLRAFVTAYGNNELNWNPHSSSYCKVLYMKHSRCCSKYNINKYPQSQSTHL